MTVPLRVHHAAWPLLDVDRRLAEHDVVLCSASLLSDDSAVARAVEMLDPDECIRYAEHANEVVARRFAVGRSILRTALGAATGVNPANVRLRTGVHGKPRLAPGFQGAPLWFSSAHSEDLYVVAMSRVADVGVDVERSRAIDQWERVAERVLDAGERETLSLAVGRGEASGDAFLRHWCRVEAELKAIGCGIAGLEAHRAGYRPLALRVADLEIEVDPGTLAPPDADSDRWHYQVAVALCSPVASSELQMAPAVSHAATPTVIPASASTA